MKSDFEPEEEFLDIVELNSDLKEETITLFLPSNYDRQFLPVKAANFRSWWQEDRKSRDHARFCLPLSMASSIGYYILSPATFTVEWNGKDEDSAIVDVIDACSHAQVDNSNVCGGFKVQAAFVARTKRAGDFLYVKGVANQFRLPYAMTEAAVEAWWTPANFGLIYLLNQPGKITIHKGEPIAQMFVVNQRQAEYQLEVAEGDPPGRQEWLENFEVRRLIIRDYDYLRGLWHDGQMVKEHLRCWRGNSPIGLDFETEASNDLLWRKFQALTLAAFRAFKRDDRSAVQKMLPSVHGLISSDTITGALPKTKQRALNFAELLLENRMSAEAEDILSKLDSLLTAEQDLPFRAHGLLLSVAVKKDHGDFAGARETALKCLHLLDKTPMCQWRGRSLVGLCLDELAALALREGSSDEAANHLLGAACAHQHAGRRFDAMASRARLARLLLESKRHEDAGSTFERVLTERKEIYGSDHLQIAFTLMDLAFCKSQVTRHGDAFDCYKQALEIFERRLGTNSTEACQSLEGMAFACRDQGKLEESSVYFGRLRERHVSVYGRSAVPTIKTMIDLAFVLRDFGKAEEAELYFRQAIDSARSISMTGEGAALLRQALKSLSFLKRDSGEFEEAQRLLAEATSLSNGDD